MLPLPPMPPPYIIVTLDILTPRLPVPFTLPVADESLGVFVFLACGEEERGLGLGAFEEVGGAYADVDDECVAAFSCSYREIWPVGEPVEAAAEDTSFEEAW